MRYMLNGPFIKEYRNKKHWDKMRTKLTETTLISIDTNKTEHQNKV